MLLRLIKKRTAATLLILVAIASIITVSCQKELSGNGFTVTETPPDLTSRINSAVSGFVTDENDAAVEGATVTVGTSNTSTDKYGYFEVRNVSVVKNAALVTVTKPGYFKGIKTYLAAENKAAMFRIKLLPKAIAGNFNSATGGVVSLSNGLSINFPANAIVSAANPAIAYTGQVSVAAQWINPAAADLHRTMPGDLRGLDSLGFMRLLTTYGMAAVELTSASGELLQIAGGKKATLTFPIPASLLSSAPAQLPLWSFNETNGLWKQEGAATKTGNTYVGDVSHFSFWNCDVPANFVQFNCTLQSASGEPIHQALVKISVVGNNPQAAYGYTDSTGYVGGAIPANTQLLLEVFSEYGCSSASYSQTFTTATSNVALGTLVIPNTTTAAVSGNVTCSGNAVTNGYVIMQKGNTTFRFPIENDGTFAFSTVLCSNATAVTLIAQDNSSQQSGAPVNVTLQSGANAVGTLGGCGTAITEFINYSINGASYAVLAPANSLSMQAGGQSIFVSGNSGTSGTTNGFVSFSFSNTSIAAGSTQTLENFTSSQIGDSTSISGTSLVNITEYGAVGQFVAGNFTATMMSSIPPITTYNVTCSFRVRRN